MRYRLPEALGGGEYHITTTPDDRYVRADVPGVGWVHIPADALIELGPPPPEPPVGSVVLDKDDQAWQRGAKFTDDDLWYCAGGGPDQTWADLQAYAPLTLLVPAVQP